PNVSVNGLGRLTVSKKLYLSFGAVVVFLAAVVSVAFWGFGSLSTAHDRATNSVFPQVLAADATRAAAADMHFSPTRYVVPLASRAPRAAARAPPRSPPAPSRGRAGPRAPGAGAPGRGPPPRPAGGTRSTPGSGRPWPRRRPRSRTRSSPAPATRPLMPSSPR